MASESIQASCRSSGRITGMRLRNSEIVLFRVVVRIVKDSTGSSPLVHRSHSRQTRTPCRRAGGCGVCKVLCFRSFDGESRGSLHDFRVVYPPNASNKTPATTPCCDTEKAHCRRGSRTRQRAERIGRLRIGQAPPIRSRCGTAATLRAEWACLPAAKATMSKPAQNLFEEVESLSREFQRCLRRGEPVRIEDYVTKIDAVARATLFKDLLQLELRFRCTRGDTPTSDEYIRRFPEFGKQIRQAFLEPSRSSVDRIEVSATYVPTAVPKSTAVQRLGEYELINELGRGSFGIVYEARHVTRNDRVALKTLQFAGQPNPLRDADRLHSFRNEFRSLSDTNHPHLVGMQTLEFDENAELWFFTMELVDGTNFLSHVRPNGELDEPRLRAALPQLVDGISALHARQIVHRDLKPNNVLVDQSGRVVILDFGLVAELQKRFGDTVSMGAEQFAGTPRYAAPEQFSGQRPAAIDWYALGVMLYEALTGQAPFEGPLADLIVQKRTLEAPKLSGREDLPQELTTLVDHLLSRNPEKRPDGSTIISSLYADGGSSVTDIQETTSYAGSAPETLIGRETQLAQLDAARQEWLNGHRPVVVFVSGKSGEGKTALIEHMLEPLRQDRKVLVLSGRCYDRETVPYKAIDCLIDPLVAYLRSLPDDEVASLLPQDADTLAELFPMLQRVSTIAGLDLTLVRQLDPKQLQYRAFDALKALLRNIGVRTSLVIFVDDLQWGDGNSAEALLRVLSPPENATVLLLGSFRSDEAENSAFLAKWRSLAEQSDRPSSSAAISTAAIATHEIAVGPLSRDECSRLVHARVGEKGSSIGERATEVIYNATGGNPYLIEQLVDCFDPETGEVKAVPLNDVIGRRLNRLPDEASVLLDVIAVSGTALRSAEATETAGITVSTFATLNRMRIERLVRLIGSGENTVVDTYHDKIRETVIGSLDHARLRGLHLALGETIERNDGIRFDELLASIQSPTETATRDIDTPNRVFDLAAHFDAAGDQTRNLAYSLLAAERAKQQFALEISLEKYAIAEELAQEHSSHVQYRVMNGLGEAQVLTGMYSNANETLGKAVGLAETDRDRISTQAMQARSIYASGSLVESIAAYESLLSDLGIQVPKNKIGLAWHVLRGLVSQWIDNVGVLGRREEKHGWKTPLAARVLVLLTAAYMYRDPLRSIWSSFTAFRLSSRTSSRSVLHSETAALKALIMGQMLAAYPAARRLSDQALVLAREKNDVAIEAHAMFLRAPALDPLSDLEEMRQCKLDARDMYVNRDAWRATFSEVNVGLYSSVLGDVCESIEALAGAFRAATMYQQGRLAQTCLIHWARISNGGFPFSELCSRFHPVTDDMLKAAGLRVAESSWHRFHRRAEESLESSRKAMTTLREIWPIPGLSWPIPQNIWLDAISNHAAALRFMAETLSEQNRKRCRHLRREGLSTAKWAVKVEKNSKMYLPLALRELSLAYAGLGKVKKAYVYATKSLEIAGQQGAKQQSASSLLVCGQLGEQLGRPEARQQMDKAEAKLADFACQIEEANRKAMEYLGLHNEEAS